MEWIPRSYILNPHSPPSPLSVVKVVLWLSADAFVLLVQNLDG